MANARERIFSAALTNHWQHREEGNTVTFRKADRLVVLTFTEPKLHPVTALPIAQRVVHGYRTINYRHSAGTGTLAYNGRDKVGQVVDTLRGQDSGL